MPDPRDGPYASISVGRDGAMVLCYSATRVDVRVEAWNGEPPRQDGWNDVTEVEFVSTSGQAVVVSSMGIDSEWEGRWAYDEGPNVAHDGPGTYACACTEGEENAERHLIQTWPVTA